MDRRVFSHNTQNRVFLIYFVLHSHINTLSEGIKYAEIGAFQQQLNVHISKLNIDGSTSSVLLQSQLAFISGSEIITRYLEMS